VLRSSSLKGLPAKSPGDCATDNVLVERLEQEKLKRIAQGIQ